MALNKLQKLAGVSAVALSMAVAASDSWSATYTVGSSNSFSVPVSATVDNSIEVTNTTALDLGTLAAFNDATDTATLAMDVTGAITDDTAGPALLVHSTGTGTPGVIDVTGALPNTNLVITLTNANNLTCGGCTGTPGDLVLQDVYTDLGTPGSLAGSTDAEGLTDGTGNLTITYGMTIQTDGTGNAYGDGTYAGSFNAQFAY